MCHRPISLDQIIKGKDWLMHWRIKLLKNCGADELKCEEFINNELKCSIIEEFQCWRIKVIKNWSMWSVEKLKWWIGEELKILKN